MVAVSAFSISAEAGFCSEFSVSGAVAGGYGATSGACVSGGVTRCWGDGGGERAGSRGVAGFPPATTGCGAVWDLARTGGCMGAVCVVGLGCASDRLGGGETVAAGLSSGRCGAGIGAATGVGVDASVITPVGEAGRGAGASVNHHWKARPCKASTARVRLASRQRGEERWGLGGGMAVADGVEGPGGRPVQGLLESRRRWCRRHIPLSTRGMATPQSFHPLPVHP